MAKDLSILIPARNEMFLARTIEDILAHIKADTEVIAVLDGDWAKPPVAQNSRVNVIKLTKSIGQRAATNLACRLSKAKYVMKVDAHCSFDEGFDSKMLEAFGKTGDNVTMVPVMRNLWAFDWKCFHCGWKKYQGPTPEKCASCGKSDNIKRKIIWKGKENPQSTSYCFDPTPHFQYFNEWKANPDYKKTKEETGLTETMSLQGSCWMLTRKNYWDLGVCDEGVGGIGWGSQGIEVACKTWLSGGKVLVNHNTWYAHMFRTQGGDFSFPYSISSKDQKKAQDYFRNLFFENKWDKQVRPLSWLVEKFWPVKGWKEEDLKAIKKYDQNLKDPTISKEKSVNGVLVDTPQISTPTDSNLDTVQSDEKMELMNSDNIIQITEGDKRILLDVQKQTSQQDDNTFKSGSVFSIEPSKGKIYYADKDINIKILIEKLK